VRRSSEEAASLASASGRRGVKPVWVLLSGGLVFSVITVLWVLADTRVNPPSDSEHHLLFSLYYARSVHLGGLTAAWETLRSSYLAWPPCAHLIYGSLGAIIGEHAQLLRLYGLVFVPLLLWATYGVGLELGDRRSGTLAALLTLFSFGISGHIRQVSIDLPATTFIVLAVLALLRTRYFTRPLSGVLFGAAVGLCLLCRVQSLLFLAGPCLVIAISSLVRARTWTDRSRVTVWMLVAVSTALTVSAPYWSGRLPELIHLSGEHLTAGAVSTLGDPRFTAGLLFNVFSLGKLAGWSVLLAVVVSTPWLARRQREAALVLLSWVLVGVVGSSAVVAREARYMLPATPPLILVAVLGLRLLAARHRERLIALLALTVVVPTLWVAGFTDPFINSPVVRSALVEPYLTRPPERDEDTERAAAAVVNALAGALHKDPTGKTAYLLFRWREPSVLSVVTSLVLPRFPDMAFASSMWGSVPNTPTQQRQRRERDIFVVSEQDEVVDSPPIWTGEIAGRPLRLHRVAASDCLHGRIDNGRCPR
jgi:4-amino-4-deoxy-L-arabinose transferase-like glycosyltransferase